MVEVGDQRQLVAALQLAQHAFGLWVERRVCVPRRHARRADSPQFLQLQFQA